MWYCLASSWCLVLILSSSYAAAWVLPTQAYVPGCKLRFRSAAMLNNELEGFFVHVRHQSMTGKMGSHPSLEWFRSSLQFPPKYWLLWGWGRTGVNLEKLEEQWWTYWYWCKTNFGSVAVRTMWCQWRRTKYRSRKAECGDTNPCVCCHPALLWGHPSITMGKTFVFIISVAKTTRYPLERCWPWLLYHPWS